MKNWFSSLNTTTKLIVAGAILLAIYIFVSAMLNIYSNDRIKRFDARQEAAEEQIVTLERDKAVLESDNQRLKGDRLSLDAEVSVLKNTTLKTKSDITKEKGELQVVLKDLDKEDAIAAKPVGNRQRCMRINAKISVKLDCTQYD